MEQAVLKLGRRMLVTLLCSAAAIVANGPLAVAFSTSGANHRGLRVATPPLRSHIESATGVRVSCRSGIR